MIRAHRHTLRRSRGARLAAALALSSALVFAAADAQAEKVGVAAAVNPDAFSSLSGSPQTQLNIGKSIFYNERINTTGSGLVQVLLVDGSTFTVGPGSDLVIDKFVYDPRKGTGQIAASFSKGVARFVGGKISKNEGGVTVDAPAGALAIRGGIAYLQYSSPKNFSFLFVFGEYLKMAGKTIYEPGNGFFNINGQLVVKQFTAADLKLIMASLTNSTPYGGKPPDPPKPSNTTWFNTQNLNQLIVDATTEAIVTQAIEAANQPTPTTPTCQELGNCPPPPPRDGGTFNGYAVGFVDNGEGRPGVVATLTPDDMHLVLDPDLELGGVVAGIRFHRAGLHQIILPWTKTYQLNFGGSAADYVDDFTFSAQGANATIDDWRIVFENWRLREKNNSYPIGGFPGSFASRNAIDDDSLLEGLPEELCTSCEFIKWGIWDAEVKYGSSTTDEFKHGLWVAGEITPVGELPFQGTATYDGTAIGSVARVDPQQDGWIQYTATGDLHMDWNFGQRSGTLEISKFDTGFVTDGLSVSGTMVAPGQVNQFGGVISGSGLVGAATGSFVTAGDNKAGGVIGSWGAGGHVNSKPYEVIGIFGGRQTGSANIAYPAGPQ